LRGSDMGMRGAQASERKRGAGLETSLSQGKRV
jgi:hypothetical protein